MHETRLFYQVPFSFYIIIYSIYLSINWAVCGLKYVDLTSDKDKILGVHFSYKKKIQNEKTSAKVILDIQNILKLWRTQSLTTKWKATDLKALSLYEVMYLALSTLAPNHITDELIKVETNFIRKNPLRKSSIEL